MRERKTGNIAGMCFTGSFSSLSLIHARSLLRNPVCMLISVAVAVFTLMLPLAFAHTFGDSATRLARDGGLAFQLVAGIALAAYAACSLTSRAHDSGTDAMILVKPFPPALLFLSRYAGMALVLLGFSAICALATLLAQRSAEAFSPGTGLRLDLTTAASGALCIVLACGLGAAADASRRATFHTAVFCLLPMLLALAALLTGFHDRAGNWSGTVRYTLDPSTPASALLIAAGLLLFAAIALTLSMWLTSASVAAACFLLLAAGLSVDWLLATRIINPAARAIVLAVMPNWQRFWTPSTGTHAAATPLAGTLLYAGLYTAAALILGCRRFEQSEHA